MHGGVATFSKSAFEPVLSVPVIRLPAIVFPSEHFSLSVQRQEDMRASTVSPDLLSEIKKAYGGKLAAFPERARVGVVLSLLPHVMQGGEPSPPSVVHFVAGDRLKLLETRERTPAGGRLALLKPLSDEPVRAADAARLASEGEAARSLLPLVQSMLELCTDDEELGLRVCPPRAHPLWASRLEPPAEPQLPTFQRATDTVDALRLLVGAAGAAQSDRYNSGVASGMNKLRVVYDTAEASGCELEPPRKVIDWA
eukprot:CAMPEP_0119326076 /NCGR_PEP_ID=MMETSP1333-20130426/67401_1 /TAXON_ID=418940 /ORGANISM="Scyphosphaera apsteinii, Strain RCC1455" /LENGTH=253 /DNA_ID=CAMNT_0007334267 /DNA_START=54 /DNA_END=816 /DNA_ORIENTATION=+